jgi:hypothetical protein
MDLWRTNQTRRLPLNGRFDKTYPTSTYYNLMGTHLSQISPPSSPLFHQLYTPHLRSLATLLFLLLLRRSIHTKDFKTG